MMADTKNTDKELEPFFAAGREVAPIPSEELLARVLADARAEQPGPDFLAGDARPRTGWLGRLAQAVGGWPAVAGLATATVAGLWIGYAAPGQVDTLAAQIWPGAEGGYDVVDLIPSMDIFLAEGDA